MNPIILSITLAVKKRADFDIADIPMLEMDRTISLNIKSEDKRTVPGCP